MEDNISRAEKGKWFDELLRLQERIAAENVKNYIGKTYRVLCDGYGSNEGFVTGHTSGTAVIEFEGDEGLLGKFVNVKVDLYDGTLKGTIIK